MRLAAILETTQHQSRPFAFFDVGKLLEGPTRLRIRCKSMMHKAPEDPLWGITVFF
jgi:hypothetical protein